MGEIVFVRKLRARDVVDVCEHSCRQKVQIERLTVRKAGDDIQPNQARGRGANQKTVLETSLERALSAPVESTALIAKYQVPGVSAVVYEVVAAPFTVAVCV
jgi:hypothetical protein